MANETNGAQTPTPAVENPQAAVDAAVSAERHRLEEIDQIAGLFNAEMVHEAKYGATACDARELAFRAAKQATQQGRDFLTALGIDNQQSGAQSVSAVPGISIHALLAESDLRYACCPLAAPKFLSTLSLRRAT